METTLNKQSKVTKLQAEMIINIAENEFTAINGAEPKLLEDIDWVWADCVIENSIDKGVFTSLLNAKLVNHRGKGSDSVVTLTDLGFEEYKKIKLEM
jgi:hypothetical protein